jgi:chromosome partitioning protein
VILALINSKGGVAKTTTAVNVGAALARELKDRRRVLLVDLDSQASASLSLGLGRDELEPSSASVLLEGARVELAARSTAVAGLDIVPGSMRLMSADVNLAAAKAPHTVLATALHQVRDLYDYIVLDCPPSLSLLSVNAIVAADALVVPVVPEYLAIEGLANLLQAVEQVRESFDVAAPLLGVALTRVDYRTRAATEYVEQLRAHFGRDVFRTEIRVSARLAEAPSSHRVIFDHDRSSPAAVAYRDLASEIVQRSNSGRKEGKTSRRQATQRRAR